MRKKFFKLSLIFILFVPIFIDGKAMLEENLKREIKKPKSEGIASALSLGATVIPVGLGFLVKNYYLSVTGIIVGPSIGHFYANQWRRGLITAGLRVGTIAVPYALIELVEPTQNLGLVLITYTLISIPAAVILVYLITNDIYSAPASVQKYNESLLKKSSLRIVPEVNPINRSYGIFVVYCF